ncbi:cytochrome P450 [Amycolatopsis sp. NPDC005961]|uniref:cytochrome P450 n=1 Tax=Amycolatopsis sp. NPDC005961 TaxID=3156720 RepID=UPI00340E76A3
MRGSDLTDIRRNAARRLGFGHGTRRCAGQGLARLETQAMLHAPVARVDRIEPTGPPEWARNNIIHRLGRLPLDLVPA